MPSLRTNAVATGRRRAAIPPRITKNLQGDTTWKKSFFPFDIGRYIVYGLPPCTQNHYGQNFQISSNNYEAFMSFNPIPTGHGLNQPI